MLPVPSDSKLVPVEGASLSENGIINFKTFVCLPIPGNIKVPVFYCGAVFFFFFFVSARN